MKRYFINVLLFFFVMIPFGVYANDTSPTHTHAPGVVCTEHSNDNENKYRIVRRYDPYNGWAWAGAGFVFANSSLQEYLNSPVVGYQVGVAKSFYNLTPYDFFYLGLIFDTAFSKKSLASTSPTTSYDALYYYTNEQLVVGYEQILRTRYLSIFAEVGGALQQRNFSIRETNTGVLLDYTFGNQFGGTVNAGLNVKAYMTRNYSFLFRLGMNFMYGSRLKKQLNYNDDIVSVNQLNYGPFLAIAFRM